MPVEHRVGDVLLPVPGFIIGHMPGVESQERVMTEEERASFLLVSKRELIPVYFAAGIEGGIPSFLINNSLTL